MEYFFIEKMFTGAQNRDEVIPVRELENKYV